MLATAPITPTDDRVVIFSMIGHKVLLPYLVAVKSLHARLRTGRIAILDDGTLTADDRAVLARHLLRPEIRSLRDVATGACPQGGCWERLLTLLDLTADDYVVQLDSDTVTLGDVPEVADAIAANRSFTMLGDALAGERGVLSLEDFTAVYHPARGVDPFGDAHVQRAIEGNWDRLPDGEGKRYIRGCAGFAGFARGGPGREAAADFSRAAERVVGVAKWRSWGSEQVASNYLIANAADPVLLPYARYENYWNAAPGPDVRFLHFVGTHRFATGEYRRRTLKAISRLPTR